MNTTERIFDLIYKRKINAKTLSLATGISTGNISDWKNGKVNPSYGAIVKIAKYFNVSPEYLECKTDELSSVNQERPPSLEERAVEWFKHGLSKYGIVKDSENLTDAQLQFLLDNVSFIAERLKEKYPNNGE